MDALPRAFPGGVLRRLRPGDLADFRAYRSIPGLGRYQGWSAQTEVEMAAFLAAMSVAPLFPRGDWIQLGIAEPAGDRLVGDIGLFLAADARSGEVGFTLEPASQGRGIATHAVREALGLMFSATVIGHVRGVTDTRNTASVRLLERLGFRHRETVDAVFRGEPCREATYVLQRERAQPAIAAN